MSEPSARLHASTFTDEQAVKTVEQVVLRRAVAGQWTRRQIVDVLQALGIVGYESGSRLGPLGEREPLSRTEQQRRQEETS